MQENKLTTKEFLSIYLKRRPLSNALWRTAEFHEISRFDVRRPLLDLGCGDGFFAMQLFGSEIEAGIDLNVEEVGMAKKLGVYQQLYAIDAGKLPFSSQHFNTVFSNCVMEHVKALDEVLKEVSRVLKTGGRFIFTVPGDHFNELLFYAGVFRSLRLKSLAAFYTYALNKGLAHLHVEGPDFWSQRLEKAGLTLVEHKYFMGPEAMKVFDFTTPLGVASRLWRKLFNRWTIFPRSWMVPFLRDYFNRLITDEDATMGGGLLLIAQKTGD